MSHNLCFVKYKKTSWQPRIIYSRNWYHARKVLQSKLQSDMLYLLDELRVPIDTIDYGGQKTLAGSKITIFGHLCQELQNWVSQIVRCTRGRFFYHHQERDIWCPIDEKRFSGHNLHASDSNQFGHLEQKLYSWGASVCQTSWHQRMWDFFSSIFGQKKKM